MSGYVYLVLAVLCFSVLGVLHKIADFQRCGPSAINAYLFGWAWLLTTLYLLSGKSSFAIPRPATAVALVCGFCASIAILAFQKGIRFGKISTSWLIINLSTAVPTVLSIVFYGEEVGWKRGVALLTITLSLILLWKDKQREETEKKRPLPEASLSSRD